MKFQPFTSSMKEIAVPILYLVQLFERVSIKVVEKSHNYEDINKALALN